MTQSIFLQSCCDCRTQWSQRSRPVVLKWLTFSFLPVISATSNLVSYALFGARISNTYTRDGLTAVKYIFPSHSVFYHPPLSVVQDMAQLIVDRTTLMNHLLQRHHSDSDRCDAVLAGLLRLFMNYLSSAQQPHGEAYSWVSASGSSSTYLLYNRWTGFHATNIHIQFDLVVCA